jgi:hypothetical protein
MTILPEHLGIYAPRVVSVSPGSFFSLASTVTV